MSATTGNRYTLSFTAKSTKKYEQLKWNTVEKFLYFKKYF